MRKRLWLNTNLQHITKREGKSNNENEPYENDRMCTGFPILGRSGGSARNPAVSTQTLGQYRGPYNAGFGIQSTAVDETPAQGCAQHHYRAD